MSRIDQWGQHWFLEESHKKKQSDSWEDVWRYPSEYLAKRLSMILYEVDIQINRAHLTP